MAINKNHEFEELDGVKCGIVERNATKVRVGFLKSLLEFNHFTVIVVPSPAPKVAATVVKTDEPVSPEPPATTLPETFTIGVTDYTFNPINGIFGRSLKTADGHIVTLAYWEQEDKVSNDEMPYYEKG